MDALDLVIGDAQIVDGSGDASWHGWVAIRDGLIAATGTGPPPTAAELIDANGAVLAPGFIDVHSHHDFTLEATAAAPALVAQGVTTVVTGNCGFSPFPVTDVDEVRATTGFLQPELSWSWTDVAGFAAAVQAERPAVNLAPQVGHSMLRLAVIGAGTAVATAGDIAAMTDLLRSCADQGVVGFSSGLIYPPGRFADTTEIDALAQVAAACDLTYSTHLRNEGPHVLEAVDEAIGTARRTGVRLQLSHLKAMGKAQHGLMKDILARIDAARDEGLDVAGDVYPYTATATSLQSRLPSWALDGGPPALERRLRQPSTRRKIRDELAHRFVVDLDPASIVITELSSGPYSDVVGNTLSEVAESLGTDPADAGLELLASHGADVGIIDHAIAEADMELALAHPWVAVASDASVLRLSGRGLPHPRNFGTAARLLDRYVRQRHVLTLPEAVRKLTSLPASRFAVGRRGRLEVGAVADLVMFNPAAVADRASYRDPWHLSTGIDRVLVAGTDTDTRPAGHILLR